MNAATAIDSARAASAPATFDRASQHRRALIAKINVGKAQLKMHEDDYRQLLFDATGRASLTECTEPMLERMVTALRGKGFVPVRKGGKAGGARQASHPMARKARALWISLYQLGVVHNPSEQALEAFARRQLKCERLAWARQGEGARVIEALKDMAARKGWRMHDSHGRPLGRTGLKEALCEAILARLKAHGIARMDWGLHDAAWKLAGLENAREHPWSESDYEQLAARLGARLREALPRVELDCEGDAA